MKLYLVTVSQLTQLADCISAMDGKSTLSERNHQAQDAHKIIEGVMGPDASLVYGVDDEDPVAKFQRESRLKSEHVLNIRPEQNSHYVIQDERKPQGGLLQRIKDELEAIGERLGWV